MGELPVPVQDIPAYTVDPKLNEDVGVVHELSEYVAGVTVITAWLTGERNNVDMPRANARRRTLAVTLAVARTWGLISCS